VEPLSDQTLAYLAGILDVQARIGLRATQDGYLPLVAISSTNLPLLEWLGSLTGTKTYFMARDYPRHPCAAHCLEAHQHIVSVNARWEVTGAKATVLLRAVRPMMRLRTADVDSLLVATGDARFKPATLRKMAELGWPVDTDENSDQQSLAESG
jgi:hypothetical protein